MIQCKKFNSIIKLNFSLRWYSQKLKSSDNDLLNKQLKYAAYQPKNIEKLNTANRKHDSNVDKKRFSIIFPPPNVTGNLHLGHALTATIQDVLVRWKQQKGIETEWIFGTDHAGIATQIVVEKTLMKQQNKTRHYIGRENFLKEIWKWKNEKESCISNDLRKLGSSFNWEKEYFTMDSVRSNAVNEAFIRLFDKNLIYRDISLINWSCSLESAISDVEVENLEIDGKTQISIPNYNKNVTVGVLTDFAYKIVDSESEIVVSTTRPETMLGDTAIAVHPNDERYSHLRDVKLWHPYRKETIPLIFDESVDPTFGTGAVKVTPAHDRNDFEMGKRHALPNIQVISENGLIVNNFNQFSNIHRFHAREEILKDLAKRGLFRDSKSHKMILPICSRSKDIVEFMIKPQWFVRCSDLMSKKAIEVVECGKLKLVPKHFENEWYRWLSNCRDWCISRQIWWGHQIPAYKFVIENEKEIWVAAKSKQEAEKKFKIKNSQYSNYTVSRDEDVLDTWFSSALLPFSVFKWPENDNDYSKFFPLNLMETGHDILFFWVARMVMLSLELTNVVPFHEVLLHGIICDAHGRKMSKSLGNVIIPDQIINGASLDELRKDIEISVEKGIINESELEKSLEGQRKMFPKGIQECGIDALRFTLCSQNIQQHYIHFDINECVTNKLFFNKIWQATKYTINYAEKKKLNVKDINSIENLELSNMDLWILSRLANTIEIVEGSLNNYNFHLSTAALKNFFLNSLCDVYLETTKNVPQKNEVTAAHVLNICLAVGLKYMEPFTPYLAVELRQYLPENLSIDVEKFQNNDLEKEIEEILEICTKIREMKALLKLTKKTKSNIIILLKSPNHETLLRNNLNEIKHLTFSDSIELINSTSEFESLNFTAKSTASHICNFGIKLLEESSTSRNLDETINRKKLLKLEQELKNLLEITNKDGYREKANEKVQKKHFEKIEMLKLEITNMSQISN